ncbi:MAG: PaaI family thioesterase [Verrucomicrobia bacterium]|nr:PaaI family thioesterase [Verrucomicrobiota bacterium]
MQSDVLRQFFLRDQFARHAGIELIDAGPGCATARMALGPQHLNGLGTVHGGAIFTLADFTFAVAANSHGPASVAINVSISFLKAAKAGTLEAVAREIQVNPRLGHYTVEVRDESGQLIAVFNGMAYRKKESILPPKPPASTAA